MFNKIVVGIDGSDPSLSALDLACDLAKKYGSEIHLVHTPHPQTVAFALGATTGYHAATTMPSKEEVKSACDKVIKSGEGVAEKHGVSIARTYTERGDAAEHILESAKECGADLIVTGRRGLGGVGSLLQGSTTQRINHMATCACLSVA